EDRNTSEARAFKSDGGVFSCGIGRGNGPSPVHVVFIARHPASGTMRIVGVCASATLEHESDWSFAQTPTVALIPVDRRPRLTVKWPNGQGIRRWASRKNGRTYPSLLKCFNGLQAKLQAMLANDPPASDAVDQTYSGLEAREGEQRKRLIIHR